jgi:ArsR family transcriptional regulator
MPGTELIFKALADATRQRIVHVLAIEELSVTELVEVLDQPQSTVSRHLKILRDAGLVMDRRNGPTVLHSTCPPAVAPNPPRPPTAGNGGDGQSQLRHRLLDWLGRQPLDDDIRERLDRVIRARRAESAGFFDTIGARWDQLRIEAFGETFHWEALAWLLPREWTVADVGTGTGYLLAGLSARFAQVIAVDPSEAMLQAAQARPELAAARNVSFRAGSLDRLPIESGTLDLAIASLVLHHVAEPPAALGELRRCVRPGGRLLIVEQESHHDAEFHGRMGDHWWGFEPAGLLNWTRQAGFTEAIVYPLATARPTTRRGMECPKLFALAAS